MQFVRDSLAFAPHGKQNKVVISSQTAQVLAACSAFKRATNISQSFVCIWVKRHQLPNDKQEKRVHVKTRRKYNRRVGWRSGVIQPQT